MALGKGRVISVFEPLIHGRKGEYKSLLEKIRKKGFIKVRIDGLVYDLAQEKAIDRKKRHTIEVLIDRLRVESKNEKRFFN